MQFVKEEQKPKRISQTSLKAPSVRPASGWKILLDSNNRHYKLLAEITVAALYPELLAFSLQTNQLIMVELTVP